MDEKRSCKILENATNSLHQFGLVCTATVVTDNFAGLGLFITFYFYNDDIRELQLSY